MSLNNNECRELFEGQLLQNISMTKIHQFIKERYELLPLDINSLSCSTVYNTNLIFIYGALDNITLN